MGNTVVARWDFTCMKKRGGVRCPKLVCTCVRWQCELFLPADFWAFTMLPGPARGTAPPLPAHTCNTPVSWGKALNRCRCIPFNEFCVYRPAVWFMQRLHTACNYSNFNARNPSCAPHLLTIHVTIAYRSSSGKLVPSFKPKLTHLTTLCSAHLLPTHA